MYTRLDNASILEITSLRNWMIHGQKNMEKVGINVFSNVLTT